jgi:type I restriction enzyme S subunit
MKHGNVRISDLIHPVRNWNPSTSVAADFVYVDISSVDAKQKRIAEPKNVPCSSAPSRARQLLESTDVLVSTVRPNLNCVAYVPGELEGAIASTGFCVLRPNKQALDSRYLFNWVQSEAFIGDMVSKATGASYPAVSDSIIHASEIPLPPLEEQRRIAAILDKAAQLTEACASLQAAHRSMGESLFIQAFGEPRMNPLDLPSARLGAIADCQLGKMLDKKRQSGCSKRPYLRNANVRWFEIDTTDVLFMDIGDHEIDRFGVCQGDLLVCEGGEPGRSAIWKGGNGVFGFQKALHRLRADRHKVLPEYLNWALWMFAQRGLLSDHITSATIAHLTREKLVNINILIPPIPVQERFARQIEALNALSQSAKSRNQILRSLNSSTLSTLLGRCADK